MRARSHRAIPLAVTTAMLTFGACGDDEDDVSEADLDAAGEKLATEICKTSKRCQPDDFADEFETMGQCVSTYKDYYDDWNFVQDESPRCRRALKSMLECYTRSYDNMSCEEFEEDDEEYTDLDDDLCAKQVREIEAACPTVDGDDEDEDE